MGSGQIDQIPGWQTGVEGRIKRRPYRSQRVDLDVLPQCADQVSGVRNVVDLKRQRIKVQAEPIMSKNVKIKWLSETEKQDYPAALSYLSLIYKESVAKAYVKKLKRARTSEFKAKDIFRASGLSLLGISNAHVEKDRQKIKSGQGLSPLLLVRDSVNGKVILADGYHRLCAVYAFDEDALIPCKIA